jgi:hypothetical protein
MKKHGYIVRMTTAMLGSDLGQKADTIALFAVAEESPSKALQLVKDGTGVLDEKLDVVGPIRWDILTDKFSLSVGEFTHL